MSDGSSINLTSAAEDPGDGIKSVQELANMLNSGLLLDGLSQHNFRKFGLFASGADGGLTISSSNSSVSSASILSNGNSYTASISEIPSDKAKASDIQIFTRDGAEKNPRAKSNESLMTSEFSKDLDDEMRIVTNSLKNTVIQALKQENLIKDKEIFQIEILVLTSYCRRIGFKKIIDFRSR